MSPVCGRILSHAPAVATALLAAACTLPALAGSFSVTPVRIYMQARERATAITVVNEGDAELVMQADLFEWRQKPDGAEDLVATDDLILAPPILKLAPRSRQVLRLANLKPVPPGQQLTYRMVVRELPEALPGADKDVKIQIALAFSLPVFITPPGAKSQLECTAARAKDTIVATCGNTGTAYAQPVNFELSGPDGKTWLNQEVSGGYVLPQIQRRFELKPAMPVPAGQAVLTVLQDDGSKLSFHVQLAE